MSSPHKVELLVNGVRYGGWQSGSIQMSLEQFASAFRVEFTDQWGPDQDPWPIEAGDACEVLIDGERIVRGYADQTSVQSDPDSRSMKVAGRSRTADLVDCSVLMRSGQWLDSSLRTIAEDVCKPFGIDVKGDVDTRPFPRFKLEPGERGADVLKRAAKARGRLLWDDHGDLRFSQVASARVVQVLQRGVEVLKSRRTENHKERFSEYHFKGQTQATDEVSGKSASQLAGLVVDPGILRLRPLLVTSAGSNDKDLGEQAVLERNQRAGRSERVSVTVAGFRDSALGDLWRPNTLVHVRDPSIAVDAVLLVAAVSMKFGVRGAYTAEPMVTELSCTRPEAFDMVDYPARRRTQPWRT